MQVSVESMAGLERRITVEVPEVKINDLVQSRLKSMVGRVKVNGFRQGKVPFNVVAQKYGTQVRQEVVSDLLQSSFYEAVTQEKLRPASQPHIEPKPIAPGSGLEYTATFEVYPEIALAPFEQIKVERPSAQIAEEDVDNMVEVVRKKNAQWEKIDRSASDGDRVSIDFVGSVDGQAFKGNEAKGFFVVLGSGQMIQGFEENLIGKKAGEQTDFNIVFPADYHGKEIAGKTVKFDVTVNEVQGAVLPELNESFIKGLGIAEGTVDAFRKEVRDNMQREMEQVIKGKIKQQLMDKLLESNKIEVPKTLVEQEHKAVLAQQLRMKHMNNPLEMDEKAIAERAYRQVALGLILSDIVKSQSIKVTPEKLRETVAAVAQSYEKPEEVMGWYYSDKNRLAEVESRILEDQAVDWLLGQVTIKDKTTTFDELINQQGGN